MEDFTYTVTTTNTDGSTDTDTADVQVTVTPVVDVVDDYETTTEDTAVTLNVLANDLFVGSNYEVTSVATPSNGTVTFTADGTMEYTPGPNFNGSDQFEYTVRVNHSDGITSNLETATVFIIVTGEDDTNPSGTPDTATTPEDTSVNISVLADDTFTGTYGTNYIISSVTQPANGTVSIEADGTLTYTPDANFNGEEDFTYTVTTTNTDGSTDTDTADVQVTVTPVVDVVDNYETTTEDTAVTLNVLANDLFVGSNYEVNSVATPSNGTVTFTADGTMEYTPGPNFNGSDQFEYTVTITYADGTTEEESATVFIIVTGDNPSIQLLKEGIYSDANTDGVVNIGDVINYTFTVINAGDVLLSDISISDPLPGVTIIGGPISLNIGESDSTTFTGIYDITQEDINAGTVINLATVSAEEPGNDPTDTSDDITDVSEDPTPVNTPTDPSCPSCTETPLEQSPSLALIKNGIFMDESADGFAQVGETIEYRFTVTNMGNVTITGIIVTDPLVTVTGGPIDLAPGESDSTTFTAVYILTQEDINNGHVENQAFATGQGPDDIEISDTSDDDSEDEDDITVTELPVGASISLVKNGILNDENNDGLAQEGETITYIFMVTNTGNVTVTNITIEDPLVAVSGGPISLEPQESDSTSFTAMYTITAQDILNGFVVNQAIATGQDPNGDDVFDISDDDSALEDDETITILTRFASISLLKTGLALDVNGDGFINEGELIRYSFTVTNTGTFTISNITISDPLVRVEGGPIALDPGETDSTTFHANFVVTEEDIAEGLVINQAIVIGIDENEQEVSDLSDDPTDLTDNDLDGDGDPDDPTIIRFSGVLNIADIEIFNGISPDGDGRNDYFLIQGIENFPNNNVQIFNRWGLQIFNVNGYNNNDSTKRWEGTSSARATVNSNNSLPTGTYYYIVKYETPDGTRNKAGYLYMNR